jgi:uncharacterized protein (TIGR02145 family)
MVVGAMTSCSKDDMDDIIHPKYAASDKLWAIDNEEKNIHQLWSDAIAIPACNKTDFDGGDYPYKADCRNNPGYAGYLYSWPYVNANAADLCPSPWRVPTRTDFTDMDEALGGTGSYRDESSTFINANYIVSWGGSYGGYAPSTSLDSQGPSGYYWSSTEDSATTAYDLGFNSGSSNPSNYNYKRYGFQVRCVK